LNEIGWFAHIGFLGEYIGASLGKQGETARGEIRGLGVIVGNRSVGMNRHVRVSKEGWRIQ
jgi:hypothetical protein